MDGHGARLVAHAGVKGGLATTCLASWKLNINAQVSENLDNGFAHRRGKSIC
jgi:hypothetical protein